VEAYLTRQLVEKRLTVRGQALRLLAPVPELQKELLLDLGNWMQRSRNRPPGCRAAAFSTFSGAPYHHAKLRRQMLYFIYFCSKWFSTERLSAT
jgi:hypothetical protein